MSRGIVARQKNDIFVSQSREKIFFDCVELCQNNDRFPSIPSIIQINNPNNTAIIAKFITEHQKPINFIKYFRTIKRGGVGKWTNAQFAKDTGFYIQKGAPYLEKLPLQPSDLVGDESYRTVNDLISTILNNVDKFGNNGKLPTTIVDNLHTLFSAILHNEPAILRNSAKYAQCYNKYLGEILAPISYVTGWNLNDGINCKSISKIGFRLNKAQKLIDSTAIIGDNVINISSKANLGAAASVATFYELQNKLSKQEKDPFSQQIDILKIIYENDFFDGILKLANYENLINDLEHDLLLDIKDKNNLEKFKSDVYLTDNLLNIVKTYKGVSPYQIENPILGYSPVYHILSALAKQVVAKFNNDNRFANLINMLLKNENIIQINSRVKKIGNNDLMFEKFEIKNSFGVGGKLVVDASKNYSSTKIRGKISFKIK